MIDRNHPAVTQCFPDGNADNHIVMAEMFAEVIQKALPHLTADDLRNTPAGRALMADGWDRGYTTGESDGWLSCDDPGSLEKGASHNPYKETPNE